VGFRIELLWTNLLERRRHPQTRIHVFLKRYDLLGNTLLSALPHPLRMAQVANERIVEELMSQPHIKGRRISVLHIYEYVEGRGLRPQTVADRYDLDVADVYHALAYYHDHPGEMDDIRDEREAVMEGVRAEAEEHRPEGVKPPSKP
jgi:uncharacterized protein (DUF433 family)